MSRPEWLVEGAEVCLYRETRNSGGTAHLIFTTIDRVMKRDVVLADGTRMNADSLRIRNGDWESPTELLPLDDPRIATARKANVLANRSYRVGEAHDAWRRERTIETGAALIAATQAWINAKSGQK